MPFIELQSVDSTNNYARGLIEASRLPDGQVSLQDGIAIFAHEQTAGRGQMGKTWLAEKSANILLSLLINPAPLAIGQQFRLSACVAVTVHDFFARYAGDDSSVKWPNDLYWQDRKAGGILVENVIGTGKDKEPSWNWTIIGIGININQVRFDPSIPNPVSLKQITGKNFDPVKLARELCGMFESNYRLLLQEGFDTIYARYLSHLYKKDKTVRLKKDNRVFEAVIKSVTSGGQLVTEHAMEERFDFGDVEWLLS